ncbi:MAG: hypothetical protein ACFFCS_19925 [Candidatus Hodarchaeota archaeon]
MKATLESRKSVRLNWFKQEKIPFVIKRRTSISYSTSSVSYNDQSQDIYMQYEFSGLEKPIPSTSIIIFQNELPQSYLHTSGSIGKKILTDEINDTDITVKDRIVKMEQGEEKITTKPVQPHETHIYKEIQIHERLDTIKRKILFKNESANLIKNLEVTFLENKEVSFKESTPAPEKSDPPEYEWNLEIPADGSVSIEITMEVAVKSTYKIERPDRIQPSQPRSARRIQRQMMNQASEAIFLNDEGEEEFEGDLEDEFEE